MMDKLPWSWIFWGGMVLIAVRLLLNHTLSLRDHLRGLLVEHFKKEVAEARKRQNILRLQAKIRKRNERVEAERLAREKSTESPSQDSQVRRAA